MARLHTKKKGKSGSRKVKKAAKWVELSPKEIEKIIIDLRKAGNPAARIGQILRDQYSVPSVRSICKKTITQIVEEKVGKIEYPEDIMNLIRRAVNLRKHIGKQKGDLHNKLKIDSVEAKIRRLGKYYVKTGKLPADWTYDPEKARLLVR